MSTTAILIDAGPLVALLHRGDPHHASCNAVAKTLRLPLFSCWPVITEADYLLRRLFQFAVVLAALTVALLAGCSRGGAPSTTTEGNPKGADGEFASSDADKRQILDAVIRHALTDPELSDTRDFYGTPGQKRFALVSNQEGPFWPDAFRPQIEGYTLSCAEEKADVDPASPQLLGIRLDRYDLSHPPNNLNDGQISITLFNSGGDGSNSAIIIGGCIVYNNVHREGDVWRVTCNGLLDP